MSTVDWIASHHAIQNLGAGRYRIDGVLDVWPKERRWHHVKTMQRGSYGVDMPREICAQLCTDAGAASVVEY